MRRQIQLCTHQVDGRAELVGLGRGGGAGFEEGFDGGLGTAAAA